MEKITPLPWHYGKNTQEIWCASGGKTVAKVGYGNSPIPHFPAEIEEENANGKYIVKAANLFPELVEALEKASREIQRGGHADRWKTVHEIDALLAKAKEEGKWTR